MAPEDFRDTAYPTARAEIANEPDEVARRWVEQAQGKRVPLAAGLIRDKGDKAQSSVRLYPDEGKEPASFEPHDESRQLDKGGP